MFSTLYAIFAMPLIMQIAGRIQFGSRKARTLYAPITVFEKSVSFGLMLIIGYVKSFESFTNASKLSKAFAKEDFDAHKTNQRVFDFISN